MGSRPVGEWSNRSWMHGVAQDRMGLRSMRLVARGRMKPTSFWRAMAGAGGQLREQGPCRNSDRSPWLWTLAFGHYEDRRPTYGYAATLETKEKRPDGLASRILPPLTPPMRCRPPSFVSHQSPTRGLRC